MVNAPEIMPASPQTQLLENYYQKYSSQQISPSGTETVTIGLYDLVVSGFTIPINLSYVTGGIRYKQEDGDVGIGWTLTPGGRISRTLIGEPDETMNRVPNLHAEIAKHVNPDDKDRYLRSFVRASSNMYSHTYIGPSDKGCDIFSFSTIGENGHFIFSDPKDMSKVEIMEKTNLLIKPTVVNKLLTSFQITDEAGVIYNYGGTAQSNLYETASSPEYLVPVYTAWALQSIITPNRDTILFKYIKYTDNSLIEPENKSITIRDASAVPVEEGSFEIPYSLSTNLLQDITLPKYTTFLLSEIETNAQTIRFTRKADSYNQQIRVLSDVEVVDKITGKPIKKIGFTYSGRSRDPHYFLETLSVDDQIYRFGYYAEKYLSLPSFNIQNYSADLWGYYLYSPTLLDKVEKPVLHAQFKEDKFIFFFGYASLSSPTLKKLGDILKIENFKNSTYNNIAHLFSLKRITFPTGGYKEYEYEPNEYQESDSTNLVGAGIRLKQVTFGGNPGGVSVRSYKYGTNEDRLGVPSFHLTYRAFADEHVNDDRHVQPWMTDSYDTYLTRTYSPNVLGDANIGKNYTVEYRQINVYDHANISNGSYKTTYSFNLKQSVYVEPINSHYDRATLSNDGSPIYITGYQEGFRSNLASIQYYNAANGLVKSEEYTYRPTTGNKTVEGGIKIEQKLFPNYNEVDFDGFMRNLKGWPDYLYNRSSPLFAYVPYSIQSGRDILVKKVTTENTPGGPIVKEEVCNYNASNQLIESISSSSVGAGKTVVQKFKYPQEYSATGVYPEMVKRNMLSYPIEKTVINNSWESNKVTTNYALTNGMVLPDLVQVSNGGNPYNVVKYNQYDNKGNILQYNYKETTTIILWSYKYRYPIAEIKNATYSQVETAVKEVFGATIDALAKTADPDKTKLEKLRTHAGLKNALISTYTYFPSIGIESETDAAGITTYYSYDDACRLIETYILQNGIKKIIQANKYNYLK